MPGMEVGKIKYRNNSRDKKRDREYNESNIALEGDIGHSMIDRESAAEIYDNVEVVSSIFDLIEDSYNRGEEDTSAQDKHRFDCSMISEWLEKCRIVELPEIESKQDMKQNEIDFPKHDTPLQ